MIEINQQKLNLVDKWKTNGIVKDKKILDAFMKVPREKFISKDYLDEAYGDYPLPIGHGQTISQPTTVMMMTEALDLKRGYKVLEVGAGCGYQAAIISNIVGEKGSVVTTEIVPELIKLAKKNIKKLNLKNVAIVKFDGSQGYKKTSPYDAIIVTAACPRVPTVLIEQLADGGVLVAPVGELFDQIMVKILKQGDKIKEKNLGYFRFVPLKGKYGFK